MRSDHFGDEACPSVVKRGYDRARLIQGNFIKSIEESNAILPKRSCICINGSVSRLESVQDSDLDYVLIWDDISTKTSARVIGARSEMAIDKINSALAKNIMRPCDSFSCHRPISDLLSTENMFSRYCILTLVDSTFIAGDGEAYSRFLELIKKRLGEYAIGIDAETEVIRTLVWYIQREGWIDQLHFGTSVNRFSRLIQLFATILSINEFGIDSTRTTKTTWARILKLEPFVSADTSECLTTLWVRALSLKENRGEKPMLKENGFVGISMLLKIWRDLLALSETPVSSHRY
ncbi:MAG: hypothetical protein ACYC7D_13305 [Nitrososphaerales archaeon]